MKAVNLIPSEARGGGIGGARAQAPTYLVLGLLAAVLALVTVYVLTNNTVSERNATLATLNGEVAQAQAHAGQLVNYARFETLAQKRAATVRQIASTRFDWHATLSDLSKVVPANTSLQSLVATVAPGATGAAGASSGGGSNLRGDISAPAFELTGCTATQDDVARLMSRLRLIDGVTRVTLGNSQKGDSGQPGASVTSASAAPGGAAGQGCGANAPTFDLVVFFKPIPGMPLTGSGSSAPSPSATAAANNTASRSGATSGGSK